MSNFIFQDALLKDIRWDAQGLVQAICQDVHTHEILMVAWQNTETLQLTLQKSELVFWSRSRQEIWHKGGTSGNVLQMHTLKIDCDGDCLLYQVEALGDHAACHTGRRSCFYRELQPNGEWQIISAPLFDPKLVYKK